VETGAQIALPDEILRISVIGRADGKHHLGGVGAFGIRGGIRGGHILGPDFFRQIEHRPPLGPARIKGHVGDDRCDLLSGHAVMFGVFQMIAQRGIRHAGGHQRHHRDDAPGLQVDIRVVPVLPEQNIVVEMGEVGSEISPGRFGPPSA